MFQIINAGNSVTINNQAAGINIQMFMNRDTLMFVRNCDVKDVTSAKRITDAIKVIMGQYDKKIAYSQRFAKLASTIRLCLPSKSLKVMANKLEKMILEVEA